MRVTLGVVMTMLLQFGCAHDPAVVTPDRRTGRNEVHDAPIAVSPPVAAATSPPASEPYTVLEELPGISRVHAVGDGRVELCVPWKNSQEGWELATKNKSGAALTVWPLQPVFIRNVGRLGAGAHWIEYIGDRDDYLIFRDHTSFYDIIPESNCLFGVRPYGKFAN